MGVSKIFYVQKFLRANILDHKELKKKHFFNAKNSTFDMIQGHFNYYVMPKGGGGYGEVL